MKKLTDSLSNVDAPVQDRTLVMYVLNDLNAKFDNIINVIKHCQPFPTFDDAMAMLEDEEDCLKKTTKPSLTHADHSSLSTVLTASETQHDNNYQRSNQQLNNRGRGRGNKNRGRGRFSGNTPRPPYSSSSSYQNMPFPNWSPPFWPPPYPM